MTPFGFQFYPPKTDEQRAQLDRTAARLKALSPEYVSCTFGAGGSTLHYTPDTVERLHATHGLEAAPPAASLGGRRQAAAGVLDRLTKVAATRRAFTWGRWE